jgi:hypothetical protein
MFIEILRKGRFIILPYKLKDDRTGLEAEVCMVGLESSSEYDPISHPLH